MDRIHGKTLQEIWPTLNLMQIIGIAMKLRRVVGKMKSEKSTRGGGLDTGCFSIPLIDPLFHPIRGFTPVEFASYTEWWLTHEFPAKHLASPHLLVLARRLYPTKSHVFVHGDLTPRNILIDDDGRLWIVDWSEAGYYLDYVEYFCSLNHQMHILCDGWGKRRYNLFKALSLGFEPRQNVMFAAAAARMNFFRLGKAPFSEKY